MTDAPPAPDRYGLLIRHLRPLEKRWEIVHLDSAKAEAIIRREVRRPSSIGQGMYEASDDVAWIYQRVYVDNAGKFRRTPYEPMRD